MGTAKYNYRDDIKRYNGSVDAYIHIWLYLYRKCCNCRIRLLYLEAQNNQKQPEITICKPLIINTF